MPWALLCLPYQSYKVESSDIAVRFAFLSAPIRCTLPTKAAFLSTEFIVRVWAFCTSLIPRRACDGATTRSRSFGHRCVQIQ